MKNKSKIFNKCYLGNKEAVFKATVIFLMIASIFIIFETIGTYKTNKTIGQKIIGNTISFSGKGEVFVTPNIATFSFSSKKEAKTPAKAQYLSTQKMNKAINYLKENGVKDKDIKTTNYTLSPRYEWKNKNNLRNLIGYEVSQQITVKIRDTKKAGTFLAKVGDFGLSNISRLSFSIDNKEKSKREARKLAIKDAKNKAEELSQDLGITLGKIVNFSETNPYQYPYRTNYIVGSSLKTEIPQIPVGENKITSNVILTYEIR